MLGHLLTICAICLMGSFLLGTLPLWQQRQALRKSVGHEGYGPRTTLDGGLR
jgi:hypothetical protein